MELHLTENHQLKAADALISKLKQQHAADEEYIAVKVKILIIG